MPRTCTDRPDVFTFHTVEQNRDKIATQAGVTGRTHGLSCGTAHEVVVNTRSAEMCQSDRVSGVTSDGDCLWWWESLTQTLVGSIA